MGTTQPRAHSSRVRQASRPEPGGGALRPVLRVAGRWRPRRAFPRAAEARWTGRGGGNETRPAAAAPGSSPASPRTQSSRPGAQRRRPGPGQPRSGLGRRRRAVCEQVPAALSPSSATMEAQAQGEWPPIAPRGSSPARGGALPLHPRLLGASLPGPRDESCSPTSGCAGRLGPVQETASGGVPPWVMRPRHGLVPFPNRSPSFLDLARTPGPVVRARGSSCLSLSRGEWGGGAISAPWARDPQPDRRVCPGFPRSGGPAARVAQLPTPGAAGGGTRDGFAKGILVSGVALGPGLGKPAGPLQARG